MGQQKHIKIKVIGAGLAGSEAALQLANAGFFVELFEMRPKKMTEAHKTASFSELVCSNSFGSETLFNASALLKQELHLLGSFILEIAEKHRVPAGNSLAIDRESFSKEVTEKLRNCSNIKIIEEEVVELPSNDYTVLATGPLTSQSLAQYLNVLLKQSLYFYDAISPIVLSDSLDFSQMFWASRYGKGGDDFLNIPLNKEQYETLVQDIILADKAAVHDFEEEKYFESCLPIEVLANRGLKTLAFGPMKPVGLCDPKTGQRPYAVIQLRAENKYKTAFNLVGFQTRMKWPEQIRVFRKLPGLQNAEFARLGTIHRNTYLNSPLVLNRTLQLKLKPNIFVAGQLTGTEGYVESVASGLIAAKNIQAILENKEPFILPEKSILGALIQTITDENRQPFSPINVHMGLLPPLSEKVRDKKLRNQYLGEIALQSLKAFLAIREGSR